jgi:hypothetical protein
MILVGHVARVGDMRSAYKILVGNSEEKRPLGRPWCKWSDKIKVDLKEIGCEGVEWIHLTQDRDQWWDLV